MSKLIWDAEGTRFYETGVKQGVLYVQNGSTWNTGVVWNGLTAVTESPSGAEATALYADDIKYLNLISTEEFGATIEAYSSPAEFDACDGTESLVAGVNVGQQSRKRFCLCYRTAVGNDVDGTDEGYKIHVIYNAKAAPSERAYATINDSPEAITLSWELTTTPMEVTGYKPTACVTIDSTKMTNKKKALAKIEASLYGVDLYSSTGSYISGDVVLYTNKLYVCKSTTATSSAPTTTANWTEVCDGTGYGNAKLLTPNDIATIISGTED